ncbi:unnamed protein product, partial [Nippostrongylus brasiliensis]|uniref:Peptidase S1 domain-containing protein n=1 Tax=Nippostrongylus brasiliensis TaxID=27835 RepID=A0A0N4YH35_NIPBR
VRSVLIDQDFVSRRCKDGHDWAIIELEEPIEFTDSTHPICLPSRKPIIGNVLTVAGWGRSYVFNESGPMIHEIPMIVDPRCDTPWSDRLPSDADDFLCATSLNKNDYFAPRTCHGDSGSGMEQIDERGRSVLIALTSFGTLGCPANELARFTRVDPYLKPICTYTGICYST